MKPYNKIYFLFIFLLSCSTPVKKVFQAKKVSASGITTDIIKDSLKIDSHIKDQKLTINYLGCGGFYFNNNHESLFIDPFFSNHGFLHVPFKKISTKPENVDHGLQSIDHIKQTQAIFITHSHYDHLLDSPFLLDKILNKEVKIYGSTSCKHIIRTAIDTAKFHTIPQEEKWINVGDHFKILPILSDHAPHFRFPFPISLYHGEAESIKNYNSPLDKTKTKKWRGGKTYSYIIDLVNDNKTTYRVFLQSSASDAPIGLPSPHILKDKPIDLAILGGALYNNTKDKTYPQKQIEYLTPKHLLICHWEDFFRPYQEENKRFVRLTNFKKLLLAVDSQCKGSIPYYLPNPGCSIVID